MKKSVQQDEQQRFVKYVLDEARRNNVTVSLVDRDPAEL